MLTMAVRVGPIRLRGGAVEFVASATDQGRRGHVRALMARFHEIEDQLGSTVQIIEGISYFYRRFGYEYVFPTPGELVARGPIPSMPGWTMTDATPDHLDLIVELQRTALTTADVAVGHDPDMWQWLLASPAYRTIIAQNDLRVSMARVARYDNIEHLFDCAGDAEGIAAIVAHLARRGEARVLERIPFTDLLRSGLAAEPSTYARYARVSDPLVLLRALQPELNRRVAGVEIDDRDAVLTFYTSSIQFRIRRNRVYSIEPAPPVQAITPVSGLGVPPDLVATLILGPLGVEAMRERHPDVNYLRGDPLWPALFPPQTIDVQTWVYP
jgi:hypothetical protein